MKTLAEIEPRTAINATNTPGDVGSIFKITQPGSYYLTGNVTGAVGVTGIVVTADDVTVDLNGFALIGVPESLDGITASVAVNNLAVHNGTISKWGRTGVDAFDAGNSQFDNLRVSNNGWGLEIGPGGTITNCTARNNSNIGILARLGSVVRGCAAMSNGMFGIFAQGNCTVIDCTTTNNTFDGISVEDNCLVQGNHSHNNALDSGNWAALRVGSNNRIVGNQLTGTSRGLFIAGSGNYVADNIVKGNTDNYDIAPGNQLNILLSEIPESIDWPAMVTLAGSLTGVSGQHGITINAADVTIDLGGHALLGVPGSLNGITIIGASKGEIRNVEIRNGTVRNFGGIGVSSLSGFGTGYRVIGVRAIENSDGISLFGGGHLVKDCTVQGNGGDGIFTFSNSTVTGNTVNGNGGDGISSCTRQDI
ncbi:MAG: right-handed parallel beta-helix repeat-containing protein [Planctomycetes bacterium]|nr:right-handed parallel beta-helix repeat-containing protein [Planctomycetota bacterium]